MPVQNLLAIDNDWLELRTSFEPTISSEIEPERNQNLKVRVSNLFDPIYRHPAQLKTAKQVADDILQMFDALERALKHYRRFDSQTRSAADMVSGIVMNNEDYALDKVFTELEELAERVKPHIETYKDEAGLSSRYKSGGKIYDTRTPTAVSALLVIYSEFTGKKPTAWRAPDGTPGSSAAQFVIHTMNHFLGRHCPGKEALYTHIKEICAQG